MNYAQLNDDNICIAVTQSAGPLEGAKFIALASFDLSVLGKKWQGGTWVEVPV